VTARRNTKALRELGAEAHSSLWRQEVVPAIRPARRLQESHDMRGRRGAKSPTARAAAALPTATRATIHLPSPMHRAPAGYNIQGRLRQVKGRIRASGTRPQLLQAWDGTLDLFDPQSH